MAKRAPRQTVENENDEAGAVEDFVSADDLALHGFIGRFAEARRVSVSRYKEATGRWAHLGSFPAELVNEDFLQQTFRRGTYRLKLHDAAGQVLTQVSSIEIDDPLDAPAAAVPRAIEPAAAAPGAELLAFVLQQTQRQHEMLLAMISKPAAPSINDALLLKLFDRSGERQSSAGLDVKAAMDIFSKGMEVGKTADGGGGLLGAAAPILLPMIMERFGRKRAAAADEEENEMDLPDVPLIENAVRFLKPAAQANSDVGTITALTVQAGRLDAGLGGLLETVVNQPFLELLRLFGKVDPEMMQEPIAGWLQAFYSKLRDAIQSSEHSTGAARHSGNSAGNGAPGA